METHLNFPQKWQDLSLHQAKNICWALHCFQINKDQKPPELDAAIFKILAKEMLRHNDKKNIKTALRELHPRAYIPFIQWIFKGMELQEFPKKITIKDQEFYGPDYRLKNISMAEFSFCDALYYRYRKTQKDLYLNLLCAALYRVKKPQEDLVDPRQPFDKSLVEKFADTVANLNKKDKIHILYAYEGSRNYMVNQFPKVFPKRPSTAKSEPIYKPFGELIAFKIKFDPSKLETVEKMNCYKFLGIYENELKQPKPKPQKRWKR